MLEKEQLQICYITDEIFEQTEVSWTFQRSNFGPTEKEMRMAVFRVVVSYSLVEIYQRFRDHS
jgi:hypothetical protein